MAGLLCKSSFVPEAMCALPTLQRILVCGWGEAAFMASVLRELDHGPAALPAGSEVVLFNQHDPPDQLPSVCRCCNCETCSSSAEQWLVCSCQCGVLHSRGGALVRVCWCVVAPTRCQVSGHAHSV
jgi:hypothetical protein